jgi:hypothetical protein
MPSAPETCDWELARQKPLYTYTPAHVQASISERAGNNEALYVEWVDWPAINCPDPRGSCDTFQEGSYCPVEQPPWSAYR